MTSVDLKARVTGIGLWSPGYPTAAGWPNPNPDAPTLPKAKVLDRQCARRASPFAKAMAMAFHEALVQSGAEATEVAAIFGSSLGETQVMIKLLDQMRVGQDDFSPMLFAVSVHNAASGLVSISTKNRAFTTSVAADYDTPVMGLMEAIAASADLGVPAVLVCGDEASPEGLVPELETFETLAVAVVVDATAHREHTPGLADLRGFRVETTSRSETHETIPSRLLRNPNVGLLSVVDAIARRRFGRVPLDQGEGSGWTVEVFETT